MTKMGRPKLPKKLAKGALLSVRFTAEEKRVLDLAAERASARLSEWARAVLLDAAARVP